jgi:hypothetical protein
MAKTEVGRLGDVKNRKHQEVYKAWLRKLEVIEQRQGAILLRNRQVMK